MTKRTESVGTSFQERFDHQLPPQGTKPRTSVVNAVEDAVGWARVNTLHRSARKGHKGTKANRPPGKKAGVASKWQKHDDFKIAKKVDNVREELYNGRRTAASKAAREWKTEEKSGDAEAEEKGGGGEEQYKT